MTRDEKSQIHETILTAEETLTSQMWAAQQRLGGAFKSTHEQLEVAVEVGALATALQHLRKSRALIKVSPEVKS